MNFSTLAETIQSDSIQHLKVSTSSLGGSESGFVHLSLDKKEDWINNIFHNSRYAIFTIGRDNKLELISKHYNMPKFRKCKVKSIENVAEKIRNYCNSVKP